MAALVNNSSGEEQTKKVYFYDDDIINWSIGSAYTRRPFANQAEKEAAVMWEKDQSDKKEQRL